MAKCTGVRCPMQVGYKTDKCIQTDCPYRTEPITNADRIRAMSDEELTELLWDAYNAGSDDAEAWHFGDGHRYSFEWDLEWLQKPAEEET